MVKWLEEITVTEGESDNFYHFHDNRVLPSEHPRLRVGCVLVGRCTCASRSSGCSGDWGIDLCTIGCWLNALLTWSGCFAGHVTDEIAKKEGERHSCASDPVRSSSSGTLIL